MTDIDIPACDHTDPAQLAAFFGPFGFFEHYRKVTLAHCYEIVRAQQTEKVTEAKLDNLARQHPGYLDFLATNLDGRIAYERMTREDMGLRQSLEGATR